MQVTWQAARHGSGPQNGTTRTAATATVQLTPGMCSCRPVVANSLAVLQRVVLLPKAHDPAAATSPARGGGRPGRTTGRCGRRCGRAGSRSGLRRRRQQRAIGIDIWQLRVSDVLAWLARGSATPTSAGWPKQHWQQGLARCCSNNIYYRVYTIPPVQSVAVANYVSSTYMLV